MWFCRQRLRGCNAGTVSAITSKPQVQAAEIKADTVVSEAPDNLFSVLHRLIDLSGIEDLPDNYKDKFYFSLDQWDGYPVARQRLIDTSASIIEIAEGVGYQSEAAFGRVFKKHFGIAPASYRRNRKILAA